MITASYPKYSAKTVTSPLFLPGEEVKEKAVPVTGYLADAAEKSISLDYENNEIVFLYTQKLPELQYTVHYVLESHPEIQVAPSVTETVGGNTISMKLPAAAVDKEYMAAQGAGEDILAEEYYPLHNVLEIYLASSGNEVTFYYSDYKYHNYELTCLDMDGNPIPGTEPRTLSQKIGGSIDLHPEELAGYSYYGREDGNEAGRYRAARNGVTEVSFYYQKNLELEAADREKTYDGTELFLSGTGDIARAEGLISGDVLGEISYQGSQTEAGSSAAAPYGAVIRNASGADHSYYYKISYLPSVLTVTAAEVTVYLRGEQKEVTYDGKAHEITWDVESITNPLYTRDKISFTGGEAVLSRRDAGDAVLSLEGRFVNTDPSFAVTFVTTDGRLTILPAPIQITAGSGEKEYDGIPLTAADSEEGAWYISGGSFPEGEGIESLKVTGSQTVPGSSGSAADLGTLILKAGTNPANYEFTAIPGVLTVTERSVKPRITLTAKS